MSRGSSMRSRPMGTIAAASSMSACTWLGTAMARAFSADSRIVRSPSGLSSRTTSPVSVTHEVVRSPANSVSTRKRGNRRRPGSAHQLPSCRRPRQSVRCAASRRRRSSSGAGRRSRDRRSPAGARYSATRPAARAVRALRSVSCRQCVTASERRVPFTCPRISIGPVPGSSENSNDRS